MDDPGPAVASASPPTSPTWRRPRQRRFRSSRLGSREVLDLVARGLGNQEIGHRLHISHRTARNRVSDIFAKLQVADRAQAIVAARDAGLDLDKR